MRKTPNTPKKITLQVTVRLTKKELRYVTGGNDSNRLYDSQNRFYFY